jgi:hypothetical protein
VCVCVWLICLFAGLRRGSHSDTLLLFGQLSLLSSRHAAPGLSLKSNNEPNERARTLHAHRLRHGDSATQGAHRRMQRHGCVRRYAVPAAALRERSGQRY